MRIDRGAVRARLVSAPLAAPLSAPVAAPFPDVRREPPVGGANGAAARIGHDGRDDHEDHEDLAGRDVLDDFVEPEAPEPAARVAGPADIATRRPRWLRFSTLAGSALGLAAGLAVVRHVVLAPPGAANAAAQALAEQRRRAATDAASLLTTLPALPPQAAASTGFDKTPALRDRIDAPPASAADDPRDAPPSETSRATTPSTDAFRDDETPAARGSLATSPLAPRVALPDPFRSIPVPGGAPARAPAADRPRPEAPRSAVRLTPRRIPDRIEGLPDESTGHDPLDAIPITGSLRLAGSPSSAFVVRQVRETASGWTALIAPRRADPAEPRWYLAGQSLPDEWTIVRVGPDGVDLMSSQGNPGRIGPPLSIVPRPPLDR